MYLIFVMVIFQNRTKKFIANKQFDEPTLGLSREFILRGLNDSVVQAYYDYMVDTAVIFGADREIAKKDSLDVLEFETKLANVSEIVMNFASWVVNRILFVFYFNIFRSISDFHANGTASQFKWIV